MTERRFLAGKRISISISEAEGLLQIGLSQAHLTEAAVEIARYLLAAGAILVYGGDLRRNGYTETLLEIAAKHYSLNPQREPVLISYVPWPRFKPVSSDFLLIAEPYAKIIPLSPLGEDLDPALPETDYLHNWAGASEAHALSSMRARIARECVAAVALGGRTRQFAGRMPGVAEEVLMSFSERHPTYLAGGFGGCVGSIVAATGLGRGPWAIAAVDDSWLAGFRELRRMASSNGLDEHDRTRLAMTPHAQEIATLVLRGLRHDTEQGRLSA